MLALSYSAAGWRRTAGEGEGSACSLPRVGLPLLTPQPRHPLTHMAVHKPKHPILEFMALDICVCGLFS